MSTATAFVVEEVTGPDLRTIRLTSQALPRQGYELRGTHRVTVQHYPGNPDATLQVLGPSEEPTTVSGGWSDRWLAGGIMTVDDAGVFTTRDAMRLWDDVRRKGQLLRVSWDETVRYGVITEFVQRWARSQDAEWEATFTWVSQDRQDALSPVLAEVATPEDVITRVGKLIEDAIKQNKAAGASSDILAATQDGIATVRRGMARAADLNAQAQQFAAATVAVIAAPGDLARQCSALVRGIYTQARNTLNTAKLALRAAYTFERTKAATTAGYGTGDAGASASLPEDGAAASAPGGSSTGGSSQPASSAGKVLLDSLVGVATVGTATGPSAAGKALAGAVWGVKTEATLRVLARQAAVEARALVEQGERDLIAIYIARADDDLRDIARLYYGDQRFWRDLATFNDLTDSRLVKGQQVFVPRQREAAEAAYGTT